MAALRDFWRGRAAGDIEIHVHHLVERADDVAKFRQGNGVAVVLKRSPGPRLGLVHHRGRFLVHVTEKLLARELIGQTGNAAQLGASAVGDEVLALAPEQMRHLLLLAGADGAVEQRGDDGLVRHRLDMLLLEIHRHGPEDNIHRLEHAEDVLGKIHDGFFATAARGAPVEADFGFIRHGPPPVQRVAPPIRFCPPRSAGWRHFAVPVPAALRQVERPERADLLHHVVNDGFDPFALRGGNPFQAHALVFDAHVAQQAPEHLKPAQGLVVALAIVAIAQMAAANQHAVRALGQRVQNELRVHAAGAHEPDDADVGART